MKRQPYDVAAEILFLAMAGVKKTKILYSCNLSFTMCDKYIRLLLGNGLLEKKADSFYTTQKGIKYITAHQKIECLWNTT